MTSEIDLTQVMHGPIPYLAMSGRGNAAMDFYALAFGGMDLGRLPLPDRPEALMHGQIAINGGCLMLTDHMGDAQPGFSFGHLQLVMEDGRAAWDRAVAAGCTVVMPYERQPWGDDWGLLEDPFGVKWGILQPGTEG
jgi:PhnB protein